MDDLTKSVERIEKLPNGEVDLSLRPENQEALRQMDFDVDEAWLTEQHERLQMIISELKQQASPYKIPEDYILFLESYGGIQIIGGETYDFSVYGFGPMSETWYSAIISPDILPESTSYGLLPVGMLILFDDDWNSKVRFVIDLIGRIQEHCVIGIGPSSPREEQFYFPSIKNLDKSQLTWKKVADSFTDWLQRAAETEGKFGYT